MRAHSFPTRLISLSLIVTMLNLVSLPAQAAFQQQAAQKSADTARQAADAGPALDQLYELTARHALTVQQLKSGRSIHKAEWYANVWQKVTSLFTDDAEEIAAQAGTEGVIAQLLALRLQVEQDQTALMQQLAAQAKRLGEQHAAPEILQRQRDLIRTLDSRHHTLQGLLAQLAQAHHSNHHNAQRQALNALQQQLSAWQPVQAKTDLQHLPWGSPEAKVRAPITADTAGAVTPAGYTLNSPKQATTAQYTHAGAIQQWRATEYRIAQYLRDRHPLQPAAAPLSGTTPSGDWPILKSLPADIQPADTAATDDAQLSPAIQALAAQLHHNPAEIYKWVYDSIEYIPSYGSIQGADFTLQTKRGNAFDTASVLIALLRASGIPARYVYGTVDIPAKTAMDWVGGVNNLDAAQNLLSQGGVPNVGLTKNGVPVMLRLEHVWVEANIAMLPSRGGLGADATAAAGVERQWVPLDASYKRHTRTAGIDLAKAVPFNAEALINDLKSTVTVDEATGSVQNLDESKIDSAITAYQNQVKAYLEQNAPNATVGDVLGTSQIRPYQSKLLSPVLPYAVNTVISDYQVLPDQMRHYFLVKIYADNMARLEDTPYVNLRIPTTRLNGKPLAMSFKPSSKADEDLITSYLPKPHADGTPIQPSELPTSLPGYLIHLTPELTLDGQTLATGQSYRMGDKMLMDIGMDSPNSDFPKLVDKTIAAGEYHAIGYDLQGMSKNITFDNREKMEDLKFQLANSNTSILSKHESIGVLLQSGICSYFELNEKESNIAQSKMGIIQYTLPSFGTFSTHFQVTERYGVPWRITPSGTMMDVDRLLSQAVDRNNNPDQLAEFNISQGISHSYNESLVPDELFDNPYNPEAEAKSISSITALSMANTMGLKVTLINRANITTFINQSTLKSVTLTAIKDAVYAGKTVLTTLQPVVTDFWSGAGYIMLDPKTGSGAYLIEGQMDGGATSVPASGDMVYSAISSAVVLGPNKVQMNFFGKLSCNFEKVAVGFAVVAAILALNYTTPTFVRMLQVPELAAGVVDILIKAIMSAMVMIGVANASKDQLKDCDCASGIKNPETGGCWVCSKESWFPIRSRVVYAKDVTNTLGSCSKAMNSSDLIKRMAAYGELAVARDEENACWIPQHQPHIDEANKARAVAKECSTYLGILSGL